LKTLAVATDGAALDDFGQLWAHPQELHPVRYGALVTGVRTLFLPGVRPVVDQSMAMRLVVLADRLYDRDVPALSSECRWTSCFRPTCSTVVPQEILPGRVPAGGAGPRGRGDSHGARRCGLTASRAGQPSRPGPTTSPRIAVSMRRPGGSSGCIGGVSTPDPDRGSVRPAR
jgi:hypothetical protein